MMSVSALFVDIGDNVSVVDRVRLSYSYDDIDMMEVCIVLLNGCRIMTITLI